jgi:hypothetical protein
MQLMRQPMRSIILVITAAATLVASAWAATTWKKTAAANTSAGCPSGYVPVPQFTLPDGTFVPGFCVMQFEAQDDGNKVAVAKTSGTPWTNVTWRQAVTACQAAGARLIAENEWLSIAHQATTVAANWTGGAVGVGQLFSGSNDNNPAGPLNAPATAADDCYTGTNDSTAAPGDSAYSYFASNTVNTSPYAGQCRTLTLPNGQVIWDLAGSLSEWVAEIIPKASRYHGGGAQWMSYNSNDGAVQAAGTNLAVATNMPLNKKPPNGWNANQGMGRYYDGWDAVNGACNTVSEWPDNSGCRSTPYAAFNRGGCWNSGSTGGVFSLYLDSGRSSVYGGYGGGAAGVAGFRCTR